MKFKHLIDELTIDLCSFRNFINMEDIRRKCNPIVDLSIFIYDKNILNKVVIIGNFVLFLFCNNGKEKEREKIW